MTGQTGVPAVRGYTNPNSETWHYLERCAGRYRSLSRVPLLDALDDGHSVCGVCAAQWAVYERRKEP